MGWLQNFNTWLANTIKDKPKFVRSTMALPAAAFNLGVDIVRYTDTKRRPQTQSFFNYLGQQFNRQADYVAAGNANQAWRDAGNSTGAVLNAALQPVEWSQRAVTAGALYTNPDYENAGDWSQSWRDADQDWTGGGQNRKITVGTALMGNETYRDWLGPGGRLNPVPIDGSMFALPDGTDLTAEAINANVHANPNTGFIARGMDITAEIFLDPYILGGKFLKAARINMFDRPLVDDLRSAVPAKDEWVQAKSGYAPGADLLSDKAQAQVEKYSAQWEARYGSRVAQNNATRAERVDNWFAESQQQGTGANVMVRELTDLNTVDQVLNTQMFTRKGWVTGDRTRLAAALATTRSEDETRRLLGLAMGHEGSIKEMENARSALLDGSAAVDSGYTDAVNQAEELFASSDKFLRPTTLEVLGAGQDDAFSALSTPLFGRDGMPLMPTYDDPDAVTKLNILFKSHMEDPVVRDIYEKFSAKVQQEQSLLKFDSALGGDNNLMPGFTGSLNYAGSKFGLVESMRASRGQRRARRAINDQSIRGRTAPGRFVSRVYRASGLSRPLRFMTWLGQKMPPGMIAVSGPQAGQAAEGVSAFLNASSMYARRSYRASNGMNGVDRKRQLLANFANAGGTDSARRDAIRNLERTFMEDTATYYGVDPQLAREIYNMYARNRAKVEATKRDVGFWADDGEIRTAVGFTGQLENGVSLVDPAMFEALMQRHAQTLHAFGRPITNPALTGLWRGIRGGVGATGNEAGEGISRSAQLWNRNFTLGGVKDRAYALYTMFERIWKPSVLVLGRLGYAPRNIAESNLRTFMLTGRLASMNPFQSMGRALSNAASSWFVGMGNTVRGVGRNGWRSWQLRKLRGDGQSLDTRIQDMADQARLYEEYANNAYAQIDGMKAGTRSPDNQMRAWRADNPRPDEVEPLIVYHGTNLADARAMTDGGQNLFDSTKTRTGQNPDRMPGLSVAYNPEDYRVVGAATGADSRARVRYSDDLAARERQAADELAAAKKGTPEYDAALANQRKLEDERRWFDENEFVEDPSLPFYAQGARIMYEVRPQNPQYQKLNPSTGPRGQADEGVDFVYGPVDGGDVRAYDPNVSGYRAQEGLVVDPSIARPVAIERWIPEPGTKRGKWVTVQKFDQADDAAELAADGGRITDRWFSKSREVAERYLQPGGTLRYVDIPLDQADEFVAANLGDDVARFASDADNDLFLPTGFADQRLDAVNISDFSTRIEELSKEAANNLDQAKALRANARQTQLDRDEIADRLAVLELKGNISRKPRRVRKAMVAELEARQAMRRELLKERKELDANDEVFTYNPEWGENINFTQHGLVPNPDDPRYPAITPRQDDAGGGVLYRDPLPESEVKDYAERYEGWLRVAQEHDAAVVAAVYSGTLPLDEARGFLKAPSNPYDPATRQPLRDRFDAFKAEEAKIAPDDDAAWKKHYAVRNELERDMMAHDRQMLQAVIRGELEMDDMDKLSFARDPEVQKNGVVLMKDYQDYNFELMYGRDRNTNAMPGQLPDELFHATTAAEKVRREGLRAADEQGDAAKPGLGGTPQYVSLGTSEKAAQQTAESHLFVAQVARGDFSVDDLFRIADEQGWEDDWAQKMYVYDAASDKWGMLGVDYKPESIQEIKQMLQDSLDNIATAGKGSPRPRQFVQELVRARKTARNVDNIDPYYVSSSLDLQRWASVPLDDIDYVKVSPDVSQRVRDAGGDAAAGDGVEYRMTSGVDLRVDDQPMPRERALDVVYQWGEEIRADNLAQIAELDDQIWKNALAVERARTLSTNGRVWNNSGVIVIGGHAIPDAYNGPNGEVARREASSQGTWQAMTMDTKEASYAVSNAALVDYGRLRVSDGGVYWNGLNRVLNQQFRNDALVRKILEGADRDELFYWGRNTTQGRNYFRRMGAANTRRDPSTGVEENMYNGLRNDDDILAWIEDHVNVVNTYTGESRVLQQLLLDGAVDARTIRRTLEDSPAGPPETIVGPVDDGSGAIQNALQAEGRNGHFGAANLGHWWDGFTSWLFKWIGTIPEDKFARHPFYAQAYRMKAAQMVDQVASRRASSLPEGATLELSRPDIMEISTRSHEFALSTLKNTLYTLEQTSNFSGMLRFVSPFAAAWENALTTWARLAYEDPARIAMIEKAWNLPNELSNAANNDPETEQLLADTVGVFQVGKYVDGQWEPTTLARGLGSDQAIRFQLPSWLVDDNAKFAPWRKLGFDSAPLQSLKGTPFEVRKASLNMVFQGENPLNPGFAPYITIPAAEVLKRRPDLYNSIEVTINGDKQTLPGLKTLVPFGPDESPTPFAALLPPVVTKVKRAVGAQFFNDREVWDSVFIYHVQTEMKNMVTDYELGKRSTMPTPEEAIDRAKKRSWLDAVVSMVAPAAVKTNSPYQFYIDEYRKLIAADWRTADDRFRELHGEEFMAFTESGSTTSTRIAPTVEAYENLEALKRDNPNLLKALLASNPGLIGELVNESGGKFDSAVYRYQMNQPVVEGSDVKMRERKTPEELLDDIEKTKVWDEYNLYSAAYDQEIARRKEIADQNEVYYPTSKNAVENADLKQWWEEQVIPELRGKSEAWFEDWEDKDETRLRRTLDAMQSVVGDRKFMAENDHDPFYESMQMYMEKRAELSAELERREWIYRSEVLPELERDNYGRLKKSDRTKYSFGLGDWENEDLQEWWDMQVWWMKTNSPQFANFYDYNLSRDFWVYTADQNTGYIQPQSLTGVR